MKEGKKAISPTGGGAVKACLALTLALGMSPAIPLAYAADNQAYTDAASTAQVGVLHVSDAESLLAAVATSGTVVLDQSITLDSNHQIVVAKGVNVTLDLAGNNLDMASGAVVRGSLTVVDTTATVPPTYDAGNGYEVTYKSGVIKTPGTTISAEDGGSFTLESGTLRSTGYGTAAATGNTNAGNDFPIESTVTINGGYQVGQEGGPAAFGNGAHVIVNGGIIEGLDNTPLAGNGTVSDVEDDGGYTIDMNGGTLIARIKTSGYASCGIYHPNRGTVNVSGGTIISINGAGIVSRAGQTNITGGTIIAMGDPSFIGKVGDSKVTVSTSAVVLDLAASYPGAQVVGGKATNADVSISGDPTLEGSKGALDVVEQYQTTTVREDNNMNVAGGTFLKTDGGASEVDPDYLPSGMSQDEKGKVVVADDAVAQVVATGAAYDTLKEAIEAAPSQSEIVLLKDPGITDTVNVSKSVNISAANGVEVTALKGKSTFILGAGAQLEGITFNLDMDGATGETNIVQMRGSNSSISDCSFKGDYEDDSSVVTRGIVVYGGLNDVRITDNTFKDLRQPAYINGSTGTVSGNYVDGTRGWVVCGDSEMELSGNTFGKNAVDIAIIDSNSDDSDFTNNYKGKAVELSEANGGAYVQNQLGLVEAKGGDLVVSTSSEYTLENAVAEAAASESDETILLTSSVQSGQIYLPVGTTIDGQGKYSITCDEPFSSDAFITMQTGADNVTLKGVTIDVNGKGRHGVEFYCNNGGKLEDVTVNGGSWTSVQINGATNVTLNGVNLNPDAGAYANIEYAMGSGVTNIPSFTVGKNGVEFADGPAQIWADSDTTGRVAGAMGNDPSDEQVKNVIVDSIKNDSDKQLSIAMGFDGESDVVTEPIAPAPEEPSTPTIPVAPSYDVTVDQADNGTVTVDPKAAKEGDKVTVTVKPDAGFELASLVVADEDGNALKLELNADGTYSFEMPAGDVTVHAAFECDGGELCPSHGFADVDQEQWYHAAIDWAVDNDVLQGVGDGLMLPDGDITRAQMAKVLWNVEGQPAAAEGEGFSDVSEGDWFAGAVAWASQEGIFVGYDGAFDPDAELTREQAAAVLMRWAESNGEDVSGRADLSGFPDADGVSEWAVESVQWAVDAGVLEGVANPDGTTTVSAQGTATRAQVAALMMRLEGQRTA